MKKFVLVGLLSLLAFTVTGCIVVLGSKDFPACCGMGMDAAARNAPRDDAEPPPGVELDERSDDATASTESQR